MRRRGIKNRGSDILSAPLHYGAGFLVMGLARLIKPHPWTCLGLGLAGISQLGFALAFPITLQIIFDSAIPEENTQLLLLILIGLGSGFFLNSGAGILQDYLGARLGAEVTFRLRHDMYASLKRLPESFFQSVGTGDLSARFSTDLAALENAVILGVPHGIYNLMLIFGSGTVLFFLEWRLALATLAIMPAAMLLPGRFERLASNASHVRKKNEAALAGTVQESILGQKVIRALGIWDIRLNRFEKQAGQLKKDAVRVNYLGSMMGRVTSLAVLFLTLVILGMGAWLSIQGHVSAGGLVAFVGLLLNLGYGAEGLADIMPPMIQAIGAYKRITDLTGQCREKPLADSFPTITRMTSGLRFERVCFSYDGKTRHLDGVSLEIPHQGAVAFVGSSGSGKSTVLELLAKFREPSGGKIFLDRQDYSEISQEQLLEQVGIVFQDTFLFNTTILENIRIGRPDASEGDVREAARLAEIHSDIMGLPDQYQTLVGEGGAGLSGGQRQRIALARCLVREPAILLLDEATSALDPATEESVNQTLARLATRMAVVSVTHRLAPVMDMDRIFVLDRGVLVESGSHHELMQGQSRYSLLWRKQSGLALSSDGRHGEIRSDKLSQFPLFSLMDKGELRSIARLFTTERFNPGDMVLEQGNPADRFYVIIKGSADVSRADSAGQVQHLAVLEVGDYMGEIGLILDVPVTATVTARMMLTCLALAKEQFLQVLNEKPAVLDAIRPVMEARIRENQSRENHSQGSKTEMLYD